MAAGVHLLIDLENVQPLPADVEAWLGEAGEAWVFYGPHQLKKKAGFEANSPRSTLVPISRTGSNSLDFHLVFYLGYLAAKHPGCRFVVLAKDTGYDPPIAHARTLAFSVERLESLGPSLKSQPAPPKAPAVASTKKKIATQSKKKAGTPSKTPVQKAKVDVPPKVKITQPPATPKKPAHKLPIEVYRSLVKDLKGPHRPGSFLALQRHIQTKFGPTAAPEKVQMLVDRLLTADVIHLSGDRLNYGPAS
jgi:hypothetical protein